jgi:glyoxylase-like metal-dependent hydrolase (beta-lactamase superfamily II)
VLKTPGHTPHHISIRIASPVPVLIAGDAVLAEDANAKIRTMIPFSGAQFRAVRQSLLEQGGLIIPGHGPAFEPKPIGVPSA